MIFKTIAAAAITVACLSGASAQEIGGRYQVQGQNANGSTYQGVAEISGTAGGNCAIRWSITNTPPTQGFCMRQGNVFSAAYRMGNAIGLVVYRLADGGALEGTWSIAGQEGVGKERLVPAR
ncbi:hypothetical protein E8L99_22110 [Phreatobacter aquaticus]|uniref:Avidin n=1 Tax=Phreatobacter aquaticus TaxID=2570229 RepID=A0A4D7QKN0_9HYPH|nr:hypothetical protein [Phreatobacter aquaticus]QCK88260.1 hypothetical protein E8L99_22110 [Phreatobacter aquaticus]